MSLQVLHEFFVRREHKSILPELNFEKRRAIKIACTIRTVRATTFSIYRQTCDQNSYFNFIAIKLQLNLMAQYSMTKCDKKVKALLYQP